MFREITRCNAKFHDIYFFLYDASMLPHITGRVRSVFFFFFLCVCVCVFIMLNLQRTVGTIDILFTSRRLRECYICTTLIIKSRKVTGGSEKWNGTSLLFDQPSDSAEDWSQELISGRKGGFSPKWVTSGCRWRKKNFLHRITGRVFFFSFTMINL